MNKCNRCESDNTKNARYCCGCGYELPKQVVEEVQNTLEIKKKSKKKLIGLIAGIITFILTFFAAYFLVQQLFNKTPSFDKELMKVASEINKTCPIMIDSETRLDNIITVPPKVFQYNYTLINIEKVDIDTLTLKNYLEPNITNFVRTSPQMKYQRDNKVTINYSYKDKEGNYLFMVSVTPEQYE